MGPLPRLLTLCCVALLVTGAAGIVGISPKPAPASNAGRHGALRPPPKQASPPVTSVTSAGSADLAAGLIAPTDMGGYYRPSSTPLTGLSAAGRCLAGLQPLAGQVGRAAEGLVTQDLYAVPQIVEIVISYPSGRTASAFDSLIAAVAACPTFLFVFNGTVVSGHLSPDSVTTAAQRQQAWSVPFDFDGVDFDLQMGLVLQGQDVLFVAWIDTATVNPAEEIMGNFGSTVTLAIGEEA